MPETLTNLDGLLKDIYADVIREQISTFDGIQEVFEKISDAEFDGRQVREVAIMAFNEGVGAISEDANLPAAGNFDPQQFAIPMRYLYGSFRMTKQMMESARTSKGAFKNATRVSFETLVRNLRRERARMLWGAGAGILARINGAVTGTVQNVDDPGGVTGAIGGARFIRPGMILALHDGTTFDEAATVSTISEDGTQVMFTASVSSADNAILSRVSLTTSTAMTDTGSNREPMGLMGLVDDRGQLVTLHGLSRNTFPALRSRVQAAVAGLTLDAIQMNLDIAMQLGDAQIDCFGCHPSVRRAYLQLLEADRRYTGANLMSPDGGTKAAKRGSFVTFGDIPFIESRNAPYDTLFGLDKRDFKRYVQIDGEWADESGAILRQVTGVDSWTAFYRLWENYHLSRPNTCFRMDGITTNKVYVASF